MLLIFPSLPFRRARRSGDLKTIRRVRANLERLVHIDSFGEFLASTTSEFIPFAQLIHFRLLFFLLSTRYYAGSLSSAVRRPGCSLPTSSPNETVPLDAWYFSFAPPPKSLRTDSSEDWETVESLLGVSRRMAELLDRVSRVSFLGFLSVRRSSLAYLHPLRFCFDYTG